MAEQNFPFQEFIYDPSFWKPRHFIFLDYACGTEATEVQLNDEAEEHARDTYTRLAVEKLVERRGG